MWKDLPEEQRQEYKKMILAFASLSKMFTQKEGSKNEETPGQSEDNQHQDGDIPIPVVNSKYQETVFQRVFGATAEDINNTSFDAALQLKTASGDVKKYLVGLKVFQAKGASGQKVAQFKANRDEWSELLEQIRSNAQGLKNKQEIDRVNHDLYMKLAENISDVRNARIESSEENLKGFKIDTDNDDVEAVYHFIMPLLTKDKQPCLRVGETSYTKIDIDNLSVEGCVGVGTPTNFKFTDGRHQYRFSSSDHQLSMNFSNYVMEDEWDVRYAEDAYAIFAGIANQIYGMEAPKKEKELQRDKISESYAWKIKIEKCSGFNGFNGAPKMGKPQRVKRLVKIKEEYGGIVDDELLQNICSMVGDIFATSDADKRNVIRQNIRELLAVIGNEQLTKEVLSMIMRPQHEVYIPIPGSRTFHERHPDFFAPRAGTFKQEKSMTNKLALPKEDRVFDLIFEPSGTKVKAFITQDNGKAIESLESQAILGKWILQGVFQLKPYEPLTEERLRRVGINGMRFYKLKGQESVHLEFIWIDSEHKPDDLLD